ncbi:MAG: hypothetical protein QW728_04370 [Thermoplasmata archaeon]
MGIFITDVIFGTVLSIAAIVFLISIVGYLRSGVAKVLLPAAGAGIVVLIAAIYLLFVQADTIPSVLTGIILLVLLLGFNYYWLTHIVKKDGKKNEEGRERESMEERKEKKKKCSGKEEESVNM